MTIETAKQSDYEELMGLYNLFVGEDRYSKYDNDSFQKVLENPLNYIFLAKDDDKIVGFITFSIRTVVRYPRPIAELDELFVLPEYRRHQVGYKLMDKVESTAKEMNCHRMFIESHYDHKAAHNFYEKLGYKNYGYHFIKNL
jgi:(aminoalkyl)phosphonate N-acetyltransferase